jgi:hypothetical protein
VISKIAMLPWSGRARRRRLIRSIYAGRALRALLCLRCDRTNVVRNPRVIKSVHPELDILAIETVLNWRYTSAVINGAMVGFAKILV